MTEAAVEHKRFWNEKEEKMVDRLIWVWSLQKSTYPDCASTAGILRVIFLMFSSWELEHNVWRHLKNVPSVTTGEHIYAPSRKEAEKLQHKV